tara:strand:+ start:1426 stop:1980 length:555 start_codon:yes stop_codon:yes gene_type:complete
MKLKLKIIIFGITAFLVANTYYDGKYTKMLLGYKKYYKMVTFAFGGLSLYLFLKKHPRESTEAFINAADLVKYIPIDSDTSNLFSSFLTTTSTNFKDINPTPQMKRMLRSGKTTVTRSVSETKKKYVASNQKWKCKGCDTMLDATFEVDHIKDLQYGGTNHVDNLRALCRNCHGKKGMMDKIQQ